MCTRAAVRDFLDIDDDVVAYGVTSEQVSALRARVEMWRRELVE